MARWKEITQYSTAVVGMGSGIVLSFFQYFGSGDVSGAVLGYVGQMLTYAAAIFGAAMYWNNKYLDLKRAIIHGDSKLDTGSLETAK